MEWHFQNGATTVWLILYLLIYVVFYVQMFSIWSCLKNLKSMKPPHPMIGRLIFENLHEILEESTFEPHRYLYINVLLRLTHWSWFLLNRPAQSSQNMQCFTHFFMRESYQYHMLLCHCLLFLPLCCPENASNTW